MVGVLSNKISREELKPGDHIYSWRQAYIYAHHGIYAGDGKVIHFTQGAGQEVGTGTFLDRIIFSSFPARCVDSPCLQCGDQSRLDGVMCSCLDCFLNGGDLYVFQYSVSTAVFLAQARGGTCTLAPSDPTEDVLHRADFLLRNGFGAYKLFDNNCEDFAIYCKTGLCFNPWGRSGQAASFQAVAGIVVCSRLARLAALATSLPVLAAVGCGYYCVSRYGSDIGVRSDVTKVPVESLVARSGIDESEAAPQMGSKK